ncbi:MAG: hypothetical protein AB7I48_26310 [Planctomycetaceae bacterium]
MINDRRFYGALVFVAVASLAALDFLSKAEPPERTLQRRRIESMTQAERERLHRNFEQFRSLSEADREKYRAVHADLEADRRDRHGRAAAALDTYTHWLQTIPVYERDALRNEQDAAAKIRLVREVLDRQRSDRMELRMGSPLENRFGPIPTLSPQDLANVLAVFHESAESALPPAAARELENYQGLGRTLKLIELLVRQDRRLFSLLTDARWEQLVNAIADDQARKMLEPDTNAQTSRPALQKFKPAVMLWKNLELAMEREARQRAVTDQKLEAVLTSLPAAEQEELFDLSPLLFRLELRTRVPEANAARPIDRRLVPRFFRQGFEERGLRGNGPFPANPNRTAPRDRSRPRDAGPPGQT